MYRRYTPLIENYVRLLIKNLQYILKQAYNATINSMKDLLPHKKTKIVATLGPATETEEMIRKLAENGMNVARFNFSHGTHEDHEKRFHIVRKLEKELNKPIAILQDLQGPKIRLGDLKEESMIITKDQNLTLFYGKEQKDERIPVQVDIFPHLKVHHKILINDGLICLKIEKLENNEATCIVVDGGEIRPHKGVNLPDTTIPNIALTQKDKIDLAFGLKLGVDYVAMSFVQTADDIRELRKLIGNGKYIPRIIAKIETSAAVKNLNDIINEADAVMVARGDMAVEIGQEEVPIVQRHIIARAREYNKPVIIATQMLESMIHNAQPTRAEVSDIANGVIEQVDALMLSAESAHGDYPLEAVMMMSKIIKRVERYCHDSHSQYVFPSVEDNRNQTTAIAAAATILAYQLNAHMIFTLTSTGKTARRLSVYRPEVPVIAVTDNPLVYRQLALSYGVSAYILDKIEDNEKAYDYIIKHMKQDGNLNTNDTVVMVTGTNPGIEGHTNAIKVTQIS